MLDLRQWALSVAGEFDDELKEAAEKVTLAAVDFARADEVDKKVYHSLLLEALASAERQANEFGRDVAARLAALVLSVIVQGV